MVWPAAWWGGVPKVAPEPSPYIWCCTWSGWWPCGSMGWCSKKLHQNSYLGWLVFSLLRWGSMGWCSKSWGGVPKSCPRIPTLYTNWVNKCSDSPQSFGHSEWSRVNSECIRVNQCADFLFSCPLGSMSSSGDIYLCSYSIQSTNLATN